MMRVAPGLMQSSVITTRGHHFKLYNFYFYCPRWNWRRQRIEVGTEPGGFGGRKSPNGVQRQRSRGRDVRTKLNAHFSALCQCGAFQGQICGSSAVSSFNFLRTWTNFCQRWVVMANCPAKYATGEKIQISDRVVLHSMRSYWSTCMRCTLQRRTWLAACRGVPGAAK